MAAMIFLALHEAGHCVGGQLSLMTGPPARQEKLSFSENERSILTALDDAAKDMSLTPLDVSRMMKFEADGMAADLIYSDFLKSWLHSKTMCLRAALHLRHAAWNLSVCARSP